jgi:hypothetical protein
MLSIVSGFKRKASNSDRLARKTFSTDPNRSSNRVATRGPTPGVMFKAIQSLIFAEKDNKRAECFQAIQKFFVDLNDDFFS